MSQLEVKVLKIFEVIPHTNADRLELAIIDGKDGFRSIIKKDSFKANDLILFIPPDSLLPSDVMKKLSADNFKLKSNKVKAIKLRGEISEGLCLNPSDWLPEEKIFDGSDVTSLLGIVKHEPTEEELPVNLSFDTDQKTKKNTSYKNKNFPKYLNIERIEKTPRCFEGLDIIATVKTHGTNFRCGFVKIEKLSIWEHIKLFFSSNYMKYGFEFLIGSHNKVLKPKTKGELERLYTKNTYAKIAKQYNLEEILRDISKKRTIKYVPAEVIFYGEIFGNKIQKGYSYGVKNGQELVIFDIKINGVFLPFDKVKEICDFYGLKTVELVYRGPYSPEVLKLAETVDEIGNWKGNREGIVIRNLVKNGESFLIKKKINPNYLVDKSNTEYH